MSVNEVVQIFKALADPTRLRIVSLLGRRDLCVCELMYVLGMEQSRVSHHMRVLREAGVAENTREGRWIIYRMAAAARPLVETLAGGAFHDSLLAGGELAADERKLDVCVRENIRGRVCDARPQGRRP
jgi:ArsR family transcriptional regulator